MAFTQEGIFGKFTGRIGNLVVYQRNGKTVIRTLSTHSIPPATGAKKQSQEQFARVMKLMQALKPFISKGFHDVAETKSAYHTAMSANIKRVRESADPLGLSWLLTSSGSRAGAEQLVIEADNHQVTVRWEDPVQGKPWKSDDHVMIVAINDTTLETSAPATTVTRALKQTRFSMPAVSEGQQVYVFISFFDGQGTKKNAKNMSEAQWAGVWKK
jgi:hypothetical protein